MVTAAMSIAIGQEPTRITEENDLLDTLAPMPAIFTHYGSWMVTGLTLAISMVTAAMSIAIGQEPIQITEENDLLEFAIQ